MSSRLFVIMANADPDRPAEAAGPLFLAIVAAAMKYRVEVAFSGAAVALARKGVAEAMPVGSEDGKTVYELIGEAQRSGVRFILCTPADDIDEDDVIPEVEKTVGGAYLISEAMDDDTETFTF